MEFNQMIGTVKFFDKSKQWGFIIHEDKEIFVHGNEIKSGEETLEKDQIVSFELKPARKGYQACNVNVMWMDEDN